MTESHSKRLEPQFCFDVYRCFPEHKVAFELGHYTVTLAVGSNHNFMQRGRG